MDFYLEILFYSFLITWLFFVIKNLIFYHVHDTLKDKKLKDLQLNKPKEYRFAFRVFLDRKNKIQKKLDSMENTQIEKVLTPKELKIIIKDCDEWIDELEKITEESSLNWLTIRKYIKVYSEIFQIQDLIASKILDAEIKNKC